MTGFTLTHRRSRLNDDLPFPYLVIVSGAKNAKQSPENDTAEDKRDNDGYGAEDESGPREVSLIDIDDRIAEAPHNQKDDVENGYAH
jgi:hypothetical protein